MHPAQTQIQAVGEFRRNHDMILRLNSGLDDAFRQDCISGVRAFLFKKYGPNLEGLCSYRAPGAGSIYRDRFVRLINYIVDECKNEDMRTTFLFLMLLAFNEMETYFLTQPLKSAHLFSAFRRTTLPKLADRYIRSSNDGMSEREFAGEVRVEYPRCCGYPLPQNFH